MMMRIMMAAVESYSRCTGLHVSLLWVVVLLTLSVPIRFTGGFSLPTPTSSFIHSSSSQQQQRHYYSTHTTVRNHQKHSALFLARRRANSNGDDKDDNDGRVTSLESLQEQQRRQSVVESLFFSTNLIEVHLQGKACLSTPVNNSSNVFGWLAPQQPEGDCLVLSTRKSPSSFSSTNEDARSCLLVPLVNDLQQALVETTYAAQPLTKTRLWRLNMMAVNRDGGLFDGLPWSTWTRDPALRNRDAANNLIDGRFHLGKRDAYNVMMGKDWKGQSLAVANLAFQLRKKLSSSTTKQEQDDEEVDEAAGILARRMLELQIRELEMDVAECDYQLAILASNNNNNNDDDFEEQKRLESERQALMDDLQACRERLEELTTAKESNKQSFMNKVLEKVEENANSRDNKAPYRGATGYDPYLDQNDDSNDDPYTSPYDMLSEIMENQLEAHVIGAVLENTSWLSGTVALGGALVLRRKTARDKITIAGEELSVATEEEDFGNPGIGGGETIVVECDADEAISMSLACDVPLQVESSILERTSVMAQPKKHQDDDDDVVNDSERTSKRRQRPRLPEWETLDPELSVLFEGQAGNLSTTERVAPVRIPRTTMSLYDSLFEPPPRSLPSSGQRLEMFPTDNPVQSLSQYDQMSNEDKAVTLMTMSNFPQERRIPRPRVVRQSEKEANKNSNDGGTQQKNALDELLLPLIDESVRREYRLRDAKRRGDTDLIEQLKREQTPRQVAKAKAAQAREAETALNENEGVADWWEREADLYDSLKADVTQDDGSYSRFLDKDEWYERDRRRTAARVDKKKFGTLLDGLE